MRSFVHVGLVAALIGGGIGGGSFEIRSASADSFDPDIAAGVLLGIGRHDAELISEAAGKEDSRGALIHFTHLQSIRTSLVNIFPIISDPTLRDTAETFLNGAFALEDPIAALKEKLGDLKKKAGDLAK